MKLKLPHKTYTLDSELEVSERVLLIEKILEDEIEFHDSTMTVEGYFRYTWNKDNTKTAMDIIGYYLTKEQKNLDVLSKDKLDEMDKGSKRHTVFSSLSLKDSVTLGLIDADDSNYN